MCVKSAGAVVCNERIGFKLVVMAERRVLNAVACNEPIGFIFVVMAEGRVGK